MLRADSVLGRLVIALAAAPPPPEPGLPARNPLRGLVVALAAAPAPQVFTSPAPPAPPETSDGRVPAQRAPAEDGAEIIVLPRFDRLRRRAAAEQVERIALDWAGDTRDVRCVLREVGPDEVELVVETSRPVADQVIRVRVTTEARDLDYLLLPTPDPSGLNVADLTMTGAGTSLTVVLTLGRPAASLGTDDLPAVARSVRATGRSGRNAWRKVARDRPSEDPVRQAVIAELGRG